MEKIWFTSDNHFCHKNVLSFCPETRQGFTDINLLNEAMIEKWNSTVNHTDTVYCLGDLSFGNAKVTLEIITRLNGQLNLVEGNHDHRWLNNETKKRFRDIRAYRRVKIQGKTVVLSHYPMREWDGMHHGSYHLYGHVHGNLPGIGRSMDVGVDARPQKDLGLWSWEEIDELLKTKEILSHNKKL